MCIAVMWFLGSIPQVYRGGSCAFVISINNILARHSFINVEKLHCVIGGVSGSFFFLTLGCNVGVQGGLYVWKCGTLRDKHCLLTILESTMRKPRYEFSHPIYGNYNRDAAFGSVVFTAPFWPPICRHWLHWQVHKVKFIRVLSPCAVCVGTDKKSIWAMK